MKALRRWTTPACLALALGLVLPAGAAARAPEPLVDVAPTGGHVRDRVLPARDGVRARAAQAQPAKPYGTPDGQTVPVRFSRSYTEDPAVAQSYVDFLGGIPHGSELSKLKLLLAPPDEVVRLCGGGEGVLACYDGASHEMIAPGEQTATVEGVSTAYVVTHEYGHHVAAFRSNTPFAALDFGPKFWASYEKVCDHVLGGRLAPGSEGRFYLQNPGESWAEAYARLVYPNERWRFTRLLRPDAGALEAARRDVLEPWTKPAVATFRGRFTRTGPDVKRFTFPLTLDGALRVQLHGPSRARYDLRVSSLGETRGRTTGNAARDRLTWRAACRERRNETIAVWVSRRSGTGAFSVDVTYAG
jgi:hypothetical protein